MYAAINLLMLAAVFLADRKKIGLGTVINIFLLGYVVEYSSLFFAWLIPEPSLAVRFVFLLLGIVIMCFSSALYFTADMGVSTYDAVALILSEKRKWKFQICRICSDLFCTVVGFAFGATVVVGTSIRASVEWFCIIEQYRELKKYKDFVQVFPEIEKMMNEDNFDSDFALAQMCLLPDMPNYFRLFGYKMIFDMMNNRYKAEQLKENFAYEIRDFWKENAKVDIFGLFPPEVEKMCSLFMDMGEGYTEEKSMKIKYMFGKEERYTFSFYIAKEDRSKLKGLRFDPIEEVFVNCKLVKAYWGEEELQLEAVSEHVSVDGCDIFLTTDPIYHITWSDNPPEGTISICLSMKRTNDVQLETYLLEGKEGL